MLDKCQLKWYILGMKRKPIIIKLEKYMRKTGTTSRAIAKALNTSEATISRWLNGHHEPIFAYEQLILALIEE
jgi:transcriptional regulator with XRE-family HTH domain